MEFLLPINAGESNTLISEAPIYSIQLIYKGECDMKQNKRAMLLIFTTAIVTSGLAILPWFII